MSSDRMRVFDMGRTCIRAFSFVAGCWADDTRIRSDGARVRKRWLQWRRREKTRTKDPPYCLKAKGNTSQGPRPLLLKSFLLRAEEVKGYPQNWEIACTLRNGSNIYNIYIFRCSSLVQVTDGEVDDRWDVMCFDLKYHQVFRQLPMRTALPQE